MKYTIIIPAYNEEKIIYKNALKVYYTLKEIQKSFDFDFTLTLLDDGSTDNTFKKILKLTKKYDEIKAISNDGPTRRENLIYNMMISSDSEYVGFMDCDLATNLNDLRNLIVFAPYYDVVSGSRYVASSKTERKTSRIIISWIFNTVIRFLFKSRIRDHECGFKMFKLSCLKKILTYTGIGNKDRRMFWDTEMWIYAQNFDMKVLEIPIDWKEGDKSALRFRTELSMLKYIFKFWIKKPWKH